MSKTNLEKVMNNELEALEGFDCAAKKQVHACLALLKEVLGEEVLGLYLYGSSVLGGLQKYSDIDLFVVLSRPTSRQEKVKLIEGLMELSAFPRKGDLRPIEMTIVEKGEVNPWCYPPKFDFQYGEWLRPQFEKGEVEPWDTKEMPDLALLITQLLLASRLLAGEAKEQLLCQVPYKDLITANAEGVSDLMKELDEDTRNVLLTLARAWNTAETGAFRAKLHAADLAIRSLPEQYRPVMERAKAIAKGEKEEFWDDIRDLIQPCADFIFNKIQTKTMEAILSKGDSPFIYLAKD